MKKFILPFFFVTPLFAGVLSVVPKDSYSYQEAPEYQAIMSHLKSYGGFSVKTKEEDVPKTKTLSRGEQMIEEAKARNRALLAEKYKEDKQQTEKASEQDGPEQWKAQVKRTNEAWKKEVKDQLRAWKREQDIFLGRIKVYQENTFVIPAKVEKIVEKKIITSDLPEVMIVNSAFNVPIRDQKNRPTCSAFAGIRAMEILLAQNGLEQDLSEQYLYWASKPDCQRAPCTEKGSWLPYGLKHSQGQPQIDIPLESTCAYIEGSVVGNETQVPLSASCRQGMAKVSGFEDVRTLADVVTALKKHIPVVMAAKLSQNFYRNQGLITLADSTKDFGLSKDGHAKGHAFLAVGLMEMPEKLKATEGAFCIVIANSWGKGWGAGGYSCLTEEWLKKFRQPSPFVAVNRLSVK